MRIGFIGLGNMGAAMAANLLKAGHDLAVWNRSADKADPLVEQGARRANSVAEACAGAELVLSMLADDHAAEAVSLGDDGIVAALEEGALHVSCSTISVDLSKRLATAHAAAAQAYVAAPVFGRPEAAAAAKLFIVACGNTEAVERARPVLETLGQRIFALSEQPETANLVKLSGNFLICSVIEALGEAMALTGKAGVDPHAYLDLLTSTLFGAPVYKTYGGLIADGRFEPAGFAVPLGAKDIRLTLAAAEALTVPMPLAGLIRERFLRLLADGREGQDWSALGGLALEDAGVRRA
jgi:3-hydroxyisobutyrate dehydrogenase-like beta-hydroxyacid dehydrogenase